MRSSLRSGFTLLEMILAAAIGVLLLAALYTAMNSQLRHVDIGREVVEETVLARAVLARIAGDINASLPPYLAPPASSSSSSGTNTSGTGGQSGSSGSSSSSTQAIGVNTVQFNLGLQGDSTSIVIYVSRVPRELNVLNPNMTPPLVSDVRRIAYWLAGGSGTPLGLARQEIKVSTSDDALNPPPTDSTDPAGIVADEVRSLQFRYYDGTTWQDSWDGTTVTGASTNGAPQGPPVAVEITIGIVPATSRPGLAPANVDPTTLKYYRHVIAIPTANGTAAASNGTSSTTGQAP